MSDPHPDLAEAGMSSPLLALPPHSFFGAPVCRDLAAFDADVALLGVPYDQGSLIPYCRVGQSQGPNAVRMNPTFFYGGNPFDGPPDPAAPCVGFYCIDDDVEYLAGVRMADIGDVVIPVGESRRLRDALAGRPGVRYTELGFQHLSPFSLSPLRLLRELARFYRAVYPLFRQAVAA